MGTPSPIVNDRRFSIKRNSFREREWLPLKLTFYASGMVSTTLCVLINFGYILAGVIYAYLACFHKNKSRKTFSKT